MRSSEVARLAGVTVRALRHYHAIGLLPEPARSDNGYRDYDIDDLVRVLRVKRLASLGFPLERIGGMLEELDADAVADGGLSAAERQLDELDAELARQIERLERQRHTIAEIKRERSLPDMPKRGARLMEVVRDIERDAGRAASVDTTDRAGMLLAAHLYDNAEFDEVIRIFTAVRDRGLSDQLYTIGERCDALAADAPQSKRDELVDEAFALLSQVIDCLDPAIWLRDYNQVERLIDASARKMMNPAQIEVSDRVEALLEQRVRDRAAEAATG